MKHAMVQANGASFHVVQAGHGAPLLLLHGWPEFWLTWEPVMERLADRYRLIAPDLRGFGDSDKPDGPFGAQDHAADVLALLDALGIERVGVIGHDVGGAAMQPLARRAPERLVGLFFFDFVYPGIGSRMAAPGRLNEIWYQSFNQMEMAPILVGASQETCRAYISHFLRHWAYRKNAFDEVMSAFVENFLKPRRWLRSLQGEPRGSYRDDKGASANVASDHGTNLRALAGTRSATPIRVDRSPWRDIHQAGPRALPGCGAFSTSREPGSRRRRDCRLF
jgi:pimeloyl-ACP methyl ester carboxylesterase